ncbi:MAG: phage baseplate assembly protein V [Rhizobiales bacterium]|nr:phage baseplate assembly protein V [Hyphomicrobiales bacterium]
MSLIKATVVKIDAAKALVKVKFEQHENMVSGWLNILQMNASNYAIYSTPEKGARVWVDMDDNFEEGVMVGAYYDADNSPPSSSAGAMHIKGKDGSEILIDGGNIKISVPGNVDIEAAADVNITAASNVTVTAAVTILDGIVKLGGANAATPVMGSSKVFVKL